MIENAYTFSLLILSIAMFALGMVFVFMKISDNPQLTAYRNAKKVMIVTYLLFAVAVLAESMERLFSEASDNALLSRMVTLIIASMQAFFFTFTMISLFNVGYATWKRFRQEVALIAAFIVAGIVSYLTLDNNLTVIYSYCFIAFYLSQLIRYTLTFTRLYHRYLLDMENWFSGYEESRLRWVYFSFFSALTIGLIALTCSIFPSALFGLISSLACLVYYVYFAIRFVNYTLIFNIFKDVIAEKPDAEAKTETEETDADSIHETAENQSFTYIQRRLDEWVANKQYCEEGITIKDLAKHLGTNITYLSQYINISEGKTFRNWIGALRIEEAKRMMLENPSHKLDIISESVGYANKSSFLLQFAKHTNMKASEWKKSHTMSTEI